MLAELIAYFRPAAVMLLAFTALTGIAYPLAMTGVAQVLMPSAANGSLVYVGDGVAGSRLVGQSFAADKYFHSRPSAAGEGYDATASSGSNLGPTSQKLVDRVKAAATALTAAGVVPADAVTASASGLDPDISPAFASLQVKRIAAARAVGEENVRSILAQHIGMPVAGIFGEPRVNVLLLNMALDADLKGANG